MSKKYHLDNIAPFDAIVIKTNILDQDVYDWANADYMESLFNTEYCSIVQLSHIPEEFLKQIATILETDKYVEPYVAPHIIGYDMNNTYEIIYNEFVAGKENVDNIKYNMIASIVDVQGQNIFGNAIILKLKTPYNDNTSIYCDITKKDIVDFLNKRVHTTVVIYEDDVFREETISGDTDYFSKVFFEEDYSRIIKIEIPFLLHNINIWYIKDEYGTEGVFGNLIDKNIKVFKGVIFTNVTNTMRGNITLVEVEKIINLSNVLDSFILSDSEKEINNDDNMKKVLKNKYRILENIYNKHKK